MMDIDKLRDLMGRVTPGPWFVDGLVWNQIVWTDSETRVCYMAHSNGLNDDRDIANASLIAMSPDLSAEVLRLTAERDALVAANQELVTENARLGKRDGEARELVQFAYDTLGEINPSNYSHDDVCNLNDKSVEVILAARAFLAGDA